MAQGLSAAQEEEYKVAFQFFDKNNSGKLDKQGAQLLLRSIGEDPTQYQNLCKFVLFCFLILILFLIFLFWFGFGWDIVGAWLGICGKYLSNYLSCLFV